MSEPRKLYRVEGNFIGGWEKNDIVAESAEEAEDKALASLDQGELFGDVDHIEVEQTGVDE